MTVVTIMTGASLWEAGAVALVEPSMAFGFMCYIVYGSRSMKINEWADNLNLFEDGTERLTYLVELAKVYDIAHVNLGQMIDSLVGVLVRYGLMLV